MKLNTAVFDLSCHVHEFFRWLTCRMACVSYVGVEKKDIEASLISGETIFRGLTLKPSALDQFNLPVEIKEGSYCPFGLLVSYIALSLSISALWAHTSEKGWFSPFFHFIPIFLPLYPPYSLTPNAAIDFIFRHIGQACFKDPMDLPWHRTHDCSYRGVLHHSRP